MPQPPRGGVGKLRIFLLFRFLKQQKDGRAANAGSAAQVLFCTWNGTAL
jgi:hypothetical protein